MNLVKLYKGIREAHIYDGILDIEYSARRDVEPLYVMGNPNPVTTIRTSRTDVTLFITFKTDCLKADQLVPLRKGIKTFFHGPGVMIEVKDIYSIEGSRSLMNPNQSDQDTTTIIIKPRTMKVHTNQGRDVECVC